MNNSQRAWGKNYTQLVGKVKKICHMCREHISTAKNNKEIHNNIMSFLQTIEGNPVGNQS